MKKELFKCDANEKAAFKEAANIIKCGYEHYPRVHQLERAILEMYSLKTGADFQKLRKAARRIRLFADIDERSAFYCSLISEILGEYISPKLFDKVSNDLIIVNKKGDFKKVANMEKIHVKGDEYVIISKVVKCGQTCLYLIKMKDEYWYGTVHLYEYYSPKDIVRAIAHVPTSMVEGF